MIEDRDHVSNPKTYANKVELGNTRRYNQG